MKRTGVHLCAVPMITSWAVKTESSDLFSILYFFMCHKRLARKPTVTVSLLSANSHGY